ncbi:E3 ubiquitin-protein ligase TRIM33-like isoform X2 [Mercenaria mercenaria]|uniref:E3 ubiquitin-protein ligase TRIM33-like isoform X2 n=1 Tax=Mercenaria mercenaria TaxID=6596 RepID=UPI00234F42BF|nr:E3 ubiquitin-protein ligase TRIM33-like isoform X2 [Mercenaria mercenaria]
MDPQAAFADAVARARQIAANIYQPALDETKSAGTSHNRAMGKKRFRKVQGKSISQAVGGRPSGTRNDIPSGSEPKDAGRTNDLQYTSDVYKEITCTPCGEDGLREEANKYCPKCQEYLCLTCAKCHQRMKATREHLLTELKQEDQSFAVLIEKCWYHPDRNIEMYCGTHDLVYCTRCIATEHRSCNGVTDVENAAEDTYSIREVQKLQDETKVIYDKLVTCNKKKEDYLIAAEDQYSDITGKIKEVKRKMTHHLEKLERKAIDALKKTKAEIRQEVEIDMSDIRTMIGKVEERSQKMERAVQMDNVQTFVQVKLSQEVANIARKLHEENESKCQKVISFTENEQISKDFMKTQYLCEINTFEQ